ncbi:MAG: hypothetical protein ACI90V_002551 [Bacillariaceae sp.]|jgi:hypothetical protein
MNESNEHRQLTNKNKTNFYFFTVYFDFPSSIDWL